MTASKKSSSSASEPYAPQDELRVLPDEPVPTYETALRQGAGGGAPSPSHHSVPSGSQAQPSYGCSPYTPHGTTRIVIVPASHWHQFPQQPHQPLLPAPVVMEATPIRRAGPRFFLALLQAFMIYMLINLLVDLTVTRKW
ncbi:chitin synthase [Pseudozyma hubeiensis SY62]|uniref:Chitin synthase n=1 Tax=Pseudozyma hubeiensis (strain SY62) TaxID=1305764 RepID=R9P7I1_PSEHS|nr:chitin synthase [Pseudozyma hubeiensis SY62]GAC94070.1 chitin synthase [Pseudozyma hubeiensis SY62]